jgi:galacturan 1,4-alpha-galacturonidase
MGGLVPQSSYESAGKPNGGGWGSITNVLFSNFNVQGASAGPAITQDSGDNGSYAGTSLMSIANVGFVNFTGYLDDVTDDVIASVSCSEVHPCYNIDFQNIDLHPSQNVSAYGNATCKYTASGGVYGLPGC